MPTALSLLDAVAFRRWVSAAAAALERCREEIDGLNVFPVADSDTGTNMLATLRAAEQSVEQRCGGTERSGGTLREVAAATAAGAVGGARGNSGVIISQLWRAVARHADGAIEADALQAALDDAHSLVRAALSTPVEGTVISVLRAAGRVSPASHVTLGDYVFAVAEAAVDALRRTPQQLSVLRDAGVVDAGGRGLLAILDALVGVVTGIEPRRDSFLPVALAGLGRPGAAISTIDLARDSSGAGDGRAVEVVDPAGHCAAGVEDYEVMYLLRLLSGSTSSAGVETLRSRLEAIGNSVVIVGGRDEDVASDSRESAEDAAGELWSVHVHCADAGAAVEAGLAVGRLQNIRISNFGVEEAARRRGALPRLGGRAVLAITRGDAAAELFRTEGAVVLHADEPPAPAQLLNAIVDTRVGEVLVLPNGAVRNEDLLAVSAAARDHGQQVLLLPAGSMVQGLAALAVHDPHRPATDDVYAMAEAAAATRTARLRVAEERALTWAGTCGPGDALGLIGEEVFVVEKRLRNAGETILDLMLGTGGELVTMLAGVDADESLTDALAEHVRRNHPAAELVLYPGGQSGDVLQIGVE